MRILILLLIPVSVYAMSSKPLTTCRGVNWVDPVERESGKPLKRSEIAYIVLWRDGKLYRQDGQYVTKYKAGTESARWFTPSGSKCPECVRAQAIDTHGVDSARGVCL